MKPDYPQILSQFQIEGTLLAINRYGSGHINSTFLVQIEQNNGVVQQFILQRINAFVFTEPEKVMANIERITPHLRQKIVQVGGNPNREALTFIPTKNGRFYHKTSTGDYWRLELFIDNAKTYQQAPSLSHYYEAAHAYGRFQAMLADFPIDQLHETIPDFHHTGKRLVGLETAVAQDKVHRATSVTPEINFLLERAEMALILTTFQESGQIPLRVTHNDTKLDNVMIDTQTGKGICVIDLDTVMPGIALFDFADAVRSSTNLAAEDEPDTSLVTFDMEIYEQLAHGFLDATRHYLSPLEIDHLAFAACLITYEQAMRFLTDYLNGDIYYQTSHPQQNLHRTRTQIKLLQLMETNQAGMSTIINKYR
jgi:Ser/Thr protein kinase RdoA (MazF antagonist)